MRGAAHYIIIEGGFYKKTYIKDYDDGFRIEEISKEEFLKYHEDACGLDGGSKADKADKADKPWYNERLSENRGFGNLKKYSGTKFEEYDDWAFYFKTFCEKRHGFNVLLEVVDGMSQCPKVEDLDDLERKVIEICGEQDGKINVREMNKELSMMLSLNLEDVALGKMKNLKGRMSLMGVNGLVAWWKLHDEVQGNQAHRSQGLASKFYAPKRLKNARDIPKGLDEWERHLKLYTESNGGQEPPKDAKLFSLRQLVPLEIERAMNEHSNTLKSFEDDMEYIMQQAVIKREVNKEDKGIHGLDDEELDYILKFMADGGLDKDESDWNNGGGEGKWNGGQEELEERCVPCGDPEDKVGSILSMIKGKSKGKSKGKGFKGKAQFQGNCRWCGKYGHTEKFCRDKDKYMDELRAKGKGKGGKDGYKGGKEKGGKGGYWYGNGGWYNAGWSGGKGGYKGNGKGYGKADTNNWMDEKPFGLGDTGIGFGFLLESEEVDEKLKGLNYVDEMNYNKVDVEDWMNKNKVMMEDCITSGGRFGFDVLRNDENEEDEEVNWPSLIEAENKDVVKRVKVGRFVRANQKTRRKCGSRVEVELDQSKPTQGGELASDESGVRPPPSGGKSAAILGNNKIPVAEQETGGAHPCGKSAASSHYGGKLMEVGMIGSRDVEWKTVDGRAWYETATSQSVESMAINFIDQYPRKLESSMWGAREEDVVVDSELCGIEFDAVDEIVADGICGGMFDEDWNYIKGLKLGGDFEIKNCGGITSEVEADLNCGGGDDLIGLFEREREFSGEINNVGSKVKQQKGFMKDNQGWTWVKTVMDSGCNESVTSRNMCPDYPIVDSPGSLRGQHYISASKDRIPNEGQQVLDIVGESGADARIRYQIADVSRPLTAVSEICDAGNRVVFGSGGGVIYNLETGRETYFNREDGIYTLNFWVRPNSGGFRRPGM